jgi:hypothetical protein
MQKRSSSAESLTSPKTYTRTSTRPSTIYDRLTVACLIIALINIVNALWMIIAPKHWYYNLPAGVPEYGPYNVHFIRDLGSTFLFLGVGLIFAAFYYSFRLPLFTMNTAFYILHMFVHIHEVVSGRIRLSMFWIDLPGVYVPAIIFSILNVIMIRKFRNESAGRQVRK